MIGLMGVQIGIWALRCKNERMRNENRFTYYEEQEHVQCDLGTSTLKTEVWGQKEWKKGIYNDDKWAVGV
jgi:hypothetical protein